MGFQFPRSKIDEVVVCYEVSVEMEGLARIALKGIGCGFMLMIRRRGLEGFRIGYGGTR